MVVQLLNALNANAKESITVAYPLHDVAIILQYDHLHINIIQSSSQLTLLGFTSYSILKYNNNQSNMKLSITSILISSASIAIVSAQTNKTLAPTPGVPPLTPAPITPFPTEPPQVSLYILLFVYVLLLQ